MKTAAVIAVVAIIALALGAFAIYQTTTLNQQSGSVNSKNTTQQNNYNNLLTNLSSPQTCPSCSSFEKLDFTGGYATKVADTQWNITCMLSNMGPSDATITDVFINGKPLSAYNNGTAYNCKVCVMNGPQIYPPAPLNIPIQTGNSSVNIVIQIVSDTSTGLFTSGQTVDIELHSAAGNDYPKSVVLP